MQLAVSSFLSQTNKDSELIIISDGCDLTQKLYEDNYKGESRIKFDRLERGVPFSGGTRNKGIEISSGDIVCYLDNDDFIGKKHLSSIVSKFTRDRVKKAPSFKMEMN